MTDPPITPTLAQAQRDLDAGRLPAAERSCRAVLAADPGSVHAHRILGLIATARHRLNDAAAHFDRGLALAPTAPLLLCGLARVRAAQGRTDEALAAYDLALRHHPDDPHARAGKAAALERSGRLDEARNLLADVVERGAEDGETAAIYATLLRRANRHEEAIRLVERHADAPPVTARKLLFTLGQSCDALGQHERAFDAFRRANLLRRVPFDPAAQRARFDRTIEVFTPEFLASVPRAANDTEQPVFIVSMPRSGSTLVEQILAAHPDVRAVGESGELPFRLRELQAEAPQPGPWPDVMRTVDRPTLDRLAARYLDGVRSRVGDARRIVDKNLGNFRLLGLIAALFPKARVLFCRRDPMAVCFSIWTLPLAPAALPYSTDLAHLGAYYREHERLMAHWMTVLDLAILEVRYEDLVTDPEPTAREIIAFTGLDWNDACLRFHEAKRDIATASYDQVRKPIYTTALKRYAPYERWMGALRAGLGLGA